MAHNHDLGECLFCIPLRFGVCLIACANFAYGFLCTGSLMLGDNRLLPGGYVPNAVRVEAVMGAAGLVFGLLGMIGTQDSKVGWVKAFISYLYVKLLVLALVFVWDMITLTDCEGTVSKSNRSLYMISSQGLCEVARLSYSIGFAVDFCANLYFTWVCTAFAIKVGLNLSYSIQFKGDFRENHTQVKHFDDLVIGDPSQYLGPPLLKSQEAAHYGTTV